MPRQFWMPVREKNPAIKEDRRGFKYTGAKPSGAKADTFLHQRYIQWHLGQTTGGRVTRDLFLNRRSAVQFLQDQFRGIPEMRRPGCARFRTRRKERRSTTAMSSALSMGSSSAYWLRLYFVKVSLFAQRAGDRQFQIVHRLGQRFPLGCTAAVRPLNGDEHQRHHLPRARAVRATMAYMRLNTS